jgi:hypothetical protein
MTKKIPVLELTKIVSAVVSDMHEEKRVTKAVRRQARELMREARVERELFIDQIIDILPEGTDSLTVAVVARRVAARLRRSEDSDTDFTQEFRNIIGE